MDNLKCNLCGFENAKIVYDLKGENPDLSYRITGSNLTLGNVRLVRCLRCGLVYVNPRESVAEINRQYTQLRDELYLSEERGRRIASRIILKKISRYKRKGRLLEIGCAAGFLLDEARKLGWEVSGIDPSSWMVSFAKERFGLELICGFLKDAKFPPNYFDVIILADVLEHFPDPKADLEKLRGMLKASGVLYISTPDIDSFASRLLRAKWWGLQHGHLYYFSRKTLSSLLDVCGFKVKKYSVYARVFSAAYWQKRLEDYSRFWSKVFSLTVRFLPSRSGLLRVNFHDQIEVFSFKKRALSFIADDEKAPLAESVKMKTVVVLPAYNAAKTLKLTLEDIPKDLVDDIILVDDASSDNTVEVARSLGLKVFVHARNKGYGANQKTCYQEALKMGADIVVMVHPDYQYDPTVISKMVEPIQNGSADAVFGSRMMQGGALEGGMPLWKHNCNILLTALENIILGMYLTEYHSGFRAYSAKYLKTVNFMANSNNFVFDNEMVVQGALHYLKIAEVPIKTRYFEEASTIKFFPSVLYGLGILKTLLKYLLHVNRIVRFRQFH